MIDEYSDLMDWFKEYRPDIEPTQKNIEDFLNSIGLEGMFYADAEKEICDGINDSFPPIEIFQSEYDVMDIVRALDPIQYRCIILEELDYFYFEGEEKYYPFWEIDNALEDVL